MPGPSYADLCGSDDCPGVPVVKVIYYQLLHRKKYIYRRVPPQVVTISVGVFVVLLFCQLCWFCCRYYRSKVRATEANDSNVNYNLGECVNVGFVSGEYNENWPGRRRRIWDEERFLVRKESCGE